MASMDWGSMDEASKRKQIADAYQRELGRAPESEDAYQHWLGNSDFASGIAGSQEAQQRKSSSGVNVRKTFDNDSSLAGGDQWSNDITNLYRQFSSNKRTPNQAEIDSHRGNPGGLDAIAAMLRSEGSGGSGGGAGNGDYSGFGNAWLASGGRTVADLQRFIAQNPQYGAKMGGSKGDKITIGGRTFDAVIGAGAGGQGASWSDITNGEGGSSGGGSNQSNELFLNEALSRMQQLRQPIDDPFQSLYSLMALQQVQGLEGAPYTAGQDAALRAQYMTPLTEARDSLRQQTTERLGARGIGPSSGLFQDAMGNLDQGYERGVAQGSNDLAVRAIDEGQNRDQRQLQILLSLLGVSGNARQEDNARGQELLQIASLFPEFDQQQLQALLAASGEGSTSPNSIAQILAQMNGQDWQSQMAQQQNGAASASAWGALIPYLLNSLTGNKAKAPMVY